MIFGGATFSFIFFAFGSSLPLHLKTDLLDDAALKSLKLITVVGFSKAPNKSVFFSTGKLLTDAARYSSGDHSEFELEPLTVVAAFLGRCKSEICHLCMRQ